MAKILFTAVVADMRNKLAGTVFSKNRYGAYTRTKVTPVNPSTAAQQEVRARFGAQAQAWRTLTESERQSWITAAPTSPVNDIFGNANILTGSAYCSQVNLNLAAINEAAITTAPVQVALPVIDGFSIAPEAGAPNFFLFSNTLVVPAGFKAIVQATGNYSPGIYFVQNKYRQIAVIDAGNAIEGANLMYEWQFVFGLLVAGLKVSARIFLVSDTSGQTGVPLSNAAIVA